MQDKTRKVVFDVCMDTDPATLETAVNAALTDEVSRLLGATIAKQGAYRVHSSKTRVKDDTVTVTMSVQPDLGVADTRLRLNPASTISTKGVEPTTEGSEAFRQLADGNQDLRMAGLIPFGNEYYSLREDYRNADINSPTKTTPQVRVMQWLKRWWWIISGAAAFAAVQFWLIGAIALSVIFSDLSVTIEYNGTTTTPSVADWLAIGLPAIPLALLLRAIWQEATGGVRFALFRVMWWTSRWLAKTIWSVVWLIVIAISYLAISPLLIIEVWHRPDLYWSLKSKSRYGWQQRGRQVLLSILGWLQPIWNVVGFFTGYFGWAGLLVVLGNRWEPTLRDWFGLLPADGYATFGILLGMAYVFFVSVHYNATASATTRDPRTGTNGWSTASRPTRISVVLMYLHIPSWENILHELVATRKRLLNLISILFFQVTTRTVVN